MKTAGWNLYITVILVSWALIVSSKLGLTLDDWQTAGINDWHGLVDILGHTIRAMGAR